MSFPSFPVVWYWIYDVVFKKMSVDMGAEVFYTMTIIKTFAGFPFRRQFSNSIYLWLIAADFQKCRSVSGWRDAFMIIA